MPAKEPRPASYFRLKLDGHESAGVFQQVSGLDSETDVVEHKAVDEQGRPFTRKVAGHVKWANIVLKRGVDENLELWKWRDTVIKQGADEARVDGMIEVLDISGTAIATFQFKQGWPIKYTGATLDATTNNVALEEVHIAHEGVERV
jgi:phage tail-like protein